MDIKKLKNIDHSSKEIKSLINPTKYEIEKLIAKPGRVIGEVFNTDAKFIILKKGKEFIKEVIKETENLGYKIDYGNIKSLEYYPVGLRVISIIAILRTFNWEKKELIEMGYNAPKVSFVVRLLVKYFVSFKRVLLESPVYWKKHYSIGRLEAYKLNMKEKFFILRIHNFHISPLLCVYYLGYFKKMAEFGGKRNIEVREISCHFKDEKCSYHEFLVTWK